MVAILAGVVLWQGAVSGVILPGVFVSVLTLALYRAGGGRAPVCLWRRGGGLSDADAAVVVTNSRKGLIGRSPSKWLCTLPERCCLKDKICSVHSGRS